MANKNYNSDEIIHIKDNDLEYIQFKILNIYNDKIKHACTLKYGGLDDRKILTFRRNSKIGEKYAQKNLEKVCTSLGITEINIYKAKQSHSDNILILDNVNKEKYVYKNDNNEEFDGYITDCVDIGTMVITADCNPIIMYDPVKNIIANVHSGWKGTLKQIYLKAINIMHEKYHSNYEDVIVCIGPSINKCCFNSSDLEFKKQFLNVWPQECEYIETKSDNKFYIDLPYVIKKDLIKIGVKEENIVLSNICTKCNSDDFFSYREYKQNNIEDYETMATIVELV